MKFRYKFFFSIFLVLVLIFSLSLSAFALDTPSSINYVVTRNGSPSLPPTNPDNLLLDDYEVFTVFFTNYNLNYGYRLEIYCPKIENLRYVIGWKSAENWLVIGAYNLGTSGISIPSSCRCYIFNESGSLVTDGTCARISSYPVRSGSDRPGLCWYFSSSVLNNAYGFFELYNSSFYSGDTISNYDGSIAYVLSPVSSFPYTINGSSPSEPDNPSGGGSSSSTGTVTPSYDDDGNITDFDINIQTDNSDIVDALGGLSEPTVDVPDESLDDDLDDYSAAVSSSDSALSSFQGDHSFSNVFSDFNLSSFQQGSLFWHNKFDDIVDSNPAFSIIITSMLTLGLLGVILNRRIGR